MKTPTPLGGLGDDDESDEDDDDDDHPLLLTDLPLSLLPEADLAADGLLDLDPLGDNLGSTNDSADLLLGDNLGGKTSPDDLLLGATPPPDKDPLGVSERLLYSPLGDNLPLLVSVHDLLLGGDSPGENLGVLEVLGVLELLSDVLLPGEGLTDGLLEARSLEGE